MPNIKHNTWNYKLQQIERAVESDQQYSSDKPVTLHFYIQPIPLTA